MWLLAIVIWSSFIWGFVSVPENFPLKGFDVLLETKLGTAVLAFLITFSALQLTVPQLDSRDYRFFTSGMLAACAVLLFYWSTSAGMFCVLASVLVRPEAKNAK
jgi:glucose uptake protein GlcU